MPDQPIAHSTYTIERNYPVSPNRVFAAFADPAKKRRWFAEGENTELKTFEMDFQVGGRERRSFAFKGKGTPMEGVVFTNETTYQDIVPNSRIVLAYTMAVNDKRISASLSSFELVPSENGTKLIYTEQAAFFEGADGPQMREAGWSHLFDGLGKHLAG